MRATLVAALVLLTSCSSGSTLAAATPTPSPSPSASPSPTAPNFGLSCELPITWTPSDADANATNSGTGLFDAESGQVTQRGPLPAPHFLTGGPSFVVEVGKGGKWVPVPASAVSGDGQFYAYAEWDPPAAGMAGGAHVANGPIIGTTGRVHLVDVATGVDRIVYSGPTYAVVGWAEVGLILAKFSASLGGSSSTGLYLLKLLPGASPQLLPHSDFQLDGGGWSLLDPDTAAWGTAFSNNEGGLGRGNELFQYSYETQAVTPWLKVAEDHTILLLGLIGRDPVVLTVKGSTSPNEPIDAHLLVVTAPNQTRELFTTVKFNDPLPGDAVGDAGGRTWFGGLGALWLYDGTSLRHIPLLDPNAIVTVSTGCVAPSPLP